MSLPKSDVLDHWLGATEAAGISTDAYRSLKTAISEQFSEDAIFGIGYSRNEPLILALDGDRFIRVMGTSAEDGLRGVPILATSISMKAPCRLDVVSAVESGLRANFLVRTWTLPIPSPTPRLS